MKRVLRCAAFLALGAGSVGCRAGGAAREAPTWVFVRADVQPIPPCLPELPWERPVELVWARADGERVVSEWHPFDRQPLDADLLGDGRLLVVGRDAEWECAVELWSFDRTPVTAAPPRPRVVRVELLGIEGTHLWRVVPLRGTPARAIVQCHPSHELALLDLETEPPTLTAIARPTRDNGLVAPQVPCFGGTHRDHGAVVVFQPPCDLACGAPYVLFDRDVDGTLEDHGPTTPERYRELGLDDPTRWLERDPAPLRP